MYKFWQLNSRYETGPDWNCVFFKVLDRSRDIWDWQTVHVGPSSADLPYIGRGTVIVLKPCVKQLDMFFINIIFTD